MVLCPSRSIKIKTVCVTNELLLVKTYQLKTCQLQSLFAEVFLECDIQQENNNPGGPNWPYTAKDIYLFFF